MNKQEFIDKLRTSLSNDFASAEVQSQVSYYSDYINEEIASGRSEADVLAELGDPWIVARSLVNSRADQMGETMNDGYKDYSEAGYEDAHGYSRTGTMDNVYGDGIGGKIQKYLFEHPRAAKYIIIGVVILALMLVFTIVMGIFNLVAPVLVPVLVILFVIRMFKDNRRRRW